MNCTHGHCADKRASKRKRVRDEQHTVRGRYEAQGVQHHALGSTHTASIRDSVPLQTHFAMNLARSSIPQPSGYEPTAGRAFTRPMGRLCIQRPQTQLLNNCSRVSVHLNPNPTTAHAVRRMPTPMRLPHRGSHQHQTQALALGLVGS